MHAYRQKRGFVWTKKHQAKSQNINHSIETDFDDIGSLKKQVKRIQIMTRMQKRTKTAMTSKSLRRPLSTNNRQFEKNRPLDFKKVQREYKREKSFMSSALEQHKKERQNEHGLLGQRKRYQEFSKQELIQKLISLEYLANTIFKKNKHLEEQLQKLKSENITNNVSLN